MQRQMLFECGAGEAFAEQHAVARDHPARFGERTVTRNEVRSRDAVAVEKDDVVAASDGGCAIASGRSAEAAIFLPEVLDRHR
jgi:hypothetical protein